MKHNEGANNSTRKLGRCKRRIISLFLCLAMVAGMIPAVSAAKGSKSSVFSDVKESDWFYPYVTELAKAGGVSGYEDSTFRPNNNIKRIELAAMAFGAFSFLDELEDDEYEEYQGLLAKVEKRNPGYWGNPYIAAAEICSIYDFGHSKGQWEKSADRGEMAHIFYMFYLEQENDWPTQYRWEKFLVNDYFTSVAGTGHEFAVTWMYANGVISGMNEAGDFCPDLLSTRAQSCTMLINMLHPERWKSVVQDGIEEEMAQKPVRLEDGIDFKGKARIRYDLDVAYDYCRQLEKKLNIQIFYLPEWTETEDSRLYHEDINLDAIDKEYFWSILEMMKSLEAVIEKYPEGFFQEIVQKKGARRMEIVLIPEGLQSWYSYDYSNNIPKTDQVFISSSSRGNMLQTHMCHEVGHAIMSAAAIRNGWNKTRAEWDAIGLPGEDPYSENDYVSRYASSRYSEDWADTWKYMWYYPEILMEKCDLSPFMKEKVNYMTDLLRKNYSTFAKAELPWGAVLE